MSRAKFSCWPTFLLYLSTRNYEVKDLQPSFIPGPHMLIIQGLSSSYKGLIFLSYNEILWSSLCVYHTSSASVWIYFSSRPFLAMLNDLYVCSRMLGQAFGLGEKMSRMMIRHPILPFRFYVSWSTVCWWWFSSWVGNKLSAIFCAFPRTTMPFSVVFTCRWILFWPHPVAYQKAISATTAVKVIVYPSDQVLYSYGEMTSWMQLCLLGLRLLL